MIVRIRSAGFVMLQFRARLNFTYSVWDDMLFTERLDGAVVIPTIKHVGTCLGVYRFFQSCFKLFSGVFPRKLLDESISVICNPSALIVVLD
jgi:hypothetical protein